MNTLINLMLTLMLIFFLSGCVRESAPSKGVGNVQGNVNRHRRASPKQRKSSLYFSKALKFMQAKEYEQALKMINRALSYSKEPIMYRARAEIYLNMGEYEKAEKNLRLALIRKPTNLEKFMIYSCLLAIEDRRGNVEGKAKVLKQLLDLEPSIDVNKKRGYKNNVKKEVAFVLYHMGLTLSDFREYQDAISRFEKSIKLYSGVKNETSILLDLADVYYNLNNLEQARKYAKEWLEIQKNKPPEKKTMHLEDMAVAYKILGNYPKSIKYITEALNIDHEEYERYLFRASIYQMAGDNDSAIKDIKTVISNTPQSSDIHQKAQKFLSKIKRGEKVYP